MHTERLAPQPILDSEVAMGLPLSLTAGLLALSLSGSVQAPALRIVVVEGEGGVNIIQQKTAVRPLVEVRDRNNLPVAGAAVTFTIGGGGQTAANSAAFAGGAQTLTVTTNAAGQAAASGLNAIRSGAFQIQVQAAYQGQLATAAISQTNFATAAAAAQAGGGGGISGMTIAIVGAAVVGGGAIAATQSGILGHEGDADAAYQGPISGQFVFTNVGGPQNPSPGSCASTKAITGTLEITLNDASTAGKADVQMTYSEIALSGASCLPNTQPVIFTGFVDVSGGPSALTFTLTTQQSGNLSTGTTKASFTGALSGSTISGTLAFETVSQSSLTLNGNTSTFNGSGSTTMPMTLQKK